MNIEELARQAEDMADAKTQSPGEFHPDWSDERNKAFAALVLEQAAQKCENHPDGLNMIGGAFVICAEAIRAMKPTQGE